MNAPNNQPRYLYSELYFYRNKARILERDQLKATRDTRIRLDELSGEVALARAESQAMHEDYARQMATLPYRLAFHYSRSNRWGRLAAKLAMLHIFGAYYIAIKARGVVRRLRGSVRV